MTSNKSLILRLCKDGLKMPQKTIKAVSMAVLWLIGTEILSFMNMMHPVALKHKKCPRLDLLQTSYFAIVCTANSKHLMKR